MRPRPTGSPGLPPPAATPPAPRAVPDLIALGAVLAVGVVVRIALLPVPGLMADLDGFARWAGESAGGGFGRVYDAGLVYPAVMPYVWWLTGLVQPALAGAVDASAPDVLVAVKLPGVIADIGLALLVGWQLRARPRWAIGAAGGLLLHPALIDISAWWGQFDSVFVLAALVAYVLAIRDRPTPAAMAIAVMLMTKPQAVVLLVPFAAWYLARHGLRGSVGPAVAAGLTVVALWLPFLPADGPATWLANLRASQDGPFGVLSLRAWNPWWILQVLAANGDFALDSGAFAGPVTFRMAGTAITAMLELIVFVAVWRSPTPRALAWGLAAATLVAVVGLTTMHERYAFAALVFLLLAVPDRRALALWAGLSVVFTLNVIAAIPPTPGLGALFPVGGPLGIAGSVAMTALAGASVLILARLRRESPSEHGPGPAPGTVTGPAPARQAG